MKLTFAELSELRKKKLTPEVRAKISTKAKLRCQDPDYRDRISRALKGHSVSIETRAKLSIATGRRHHSVKTKQKISETVKKVMSNSDIRQKLSNSNKLRWKNLTDDGKRQWMERLRASCQKSPNGAELALYEIIQAVCPGEYKYTGDLSVVIGGLNPDFTNINGQKTVIELFGDYWHKGEDPQERIDKYKEFGFDCLVIWEHELPDVISLLSKVREFKPAARSVYVNC